MQITSAAPDWKPHETPLEPKPVERLHLTDMGNAERLVRRHGKDLKYDHITGMWYVWNGRSWEPDATSEVFRRAKETALQIYVEAAECPLDEERSKIVKWAKSSESRSRIADMVSMASSEPGIPVQEEEFDVGDWILNCDNGTIDLKTGELKPHNRDDLLTTHHPHIIRSDGETSHVEQLPEQGDRRKHRTQRIPATGHRILSDRWK